MFEKEIKELERQIEELKREREIRKEQTNIGLISLTNDSLKIELLLNASDFSNEHIERLTKVANDLQELLLDVYKKEEEE